MPGKPHEWEVWIREINHIAPVELARIETHHIYPESPKPCHSTIVSNDTRTFIHTPDGKCAGLLSTKLYINLANAFHHARDSGYQVMPQPKDLNSGLVGLLSFKKDLRFISKRIKNLKTHTCEP